MSSTEDVISDEVKTTETKSNELKCTKCNQTKTKDHFTTHSDKSNGYRGDCNSCRNKNRPKPSQCIAKDEDEDVKTQVCKVCNQEKKYKEFGMKKSEKNGKNKECKKCANAKERNRHNLKNETKPNKRTNNI